MRIFLHTATLSSDVLATSRDECRPPWLGGTYHPMEEGYEFRIEPLRRGRVMIFTRPVGTKTALPLAVPAVGYSMPVDIKINEDGKPTWDMADVVGRLLGEFRLPAVQVRVLVAGKRLELASWRERKLSHSEGAVHLRDVYCTYRRVDPHDFGDETTEGGRIDTVDGAHWVIETVKDHDGRTINNVYVWTDIAQRSDEQARLWSALRQAAVQAV